ncbi:MAG: hypothetical protein ACTTJH_05910 [Bacteroidales bacterium]
MKSSKSKIVKRKSQTINISLNNKEIVLLNRYSKLNDMTKKSAIKKIIKEFLLANVSMPEDVSKNQLDLFASRETDLFDYTK